MPASPSARAAALLNATQHPSRAHTTEAHAHSTHTYALSHTVDMRAGVARSHTSRRAPLTACKAATRSRRRRQCAQSCLSHRRRRRRCRRRRGCRSKRNNVHVTQRSAQRDNARRRAHQTTTRCGSRKLAEQFRRNTTTQQHVKRQQNRPRNANAQSDAHAPHRRAATRANTASSER